MAETEAQRAERERLLSQAYNVASQTLREQHRDEFNKLYSAAAEERGVEWKPRLRPEEKAEQELLALFDQFPALRERYSPTEEDMNPVPEAEPKG